MRAIPITKRAIAANTINKAALNTGNSISTIDRAIIKSPSAMFAILEVLYFNDIAVVVVAVAVVVDVGDVVAVAIGLTTPKQILSIPMTSKVMDKTRTVVEIEEPGTNKIIAANKTEIEPRTIWSIRNQGGVLKICIIFTLLVSQHQEVLYKYHPSRVSTP
jgi:hypothetical protein